MMIYKIHAHIFWFSWWEWWIVCNLKFLVLSLIWVTKFNCGLLKLKNMIFILLIGHFCLEVFVIVEEVNKLFAFSRHISYIFGRSKVPWKRKNTARGWKQLYVALWDHDLICFEVKIEINQTKLQFYTVMKIFNHEKWKHTSIN